MDEVKANFLEACLNDSLRMKMNSLSLCYSFAPS
ncbi:hypothetical protein EMIT0357P_130009 [Pseudomonas marginalis]